MSFRFGAPSGISLGPFAASTLQKPQAIAIGAHAGRHNQGARSIAIGANAGHSNQHQSTIVLNATGIAVNTLQDNSTYISPVRYATSANIMTYNDITKEVTYSNHLSGSLGIGTTSVDTKLYVVGKTKIDDGSTSPPSTGVNGSNGTRLILWPGDATTTPYGFGMDNNTLWYGVPQNKLHKWYEGITERMRLSGGKLGIGTTNPLRTLDITNNVDPYMGSLNIERGVDDGNIYTVSFNQNTASFNMGMGAVSTARGVLAPTNYMWGNHISGGAEWGIISDGWVNLFSVRGGTGNAWFKGNVGMGTTTISAKLHVYGDAIIADSPLYKQATMTVMKSGGSASLAVCAGSESDKAILYLGTPNVPSTIDGSNSAYKVAIIANGNGSGTGWSTADLHFCLNHATGDGTNSYTQTATITHSKMVIKTNGNVGIGTTSPGSYKLYVNGTGYVNGTLAVNGNFEMNGADFNIKASFRGTGGRALVHDTSNTLAINYGGDFSSVRIDSNVSLGGNLVNSGNMNIGLPTTNTYQAPISKFTINASYSGGDGGAFAINAYDGSVYNLRLFPYVQAVGQVAYLFKTYNQGTGYDSITIGHNGNVGIKYTNPLCTLYNRQDGTSGWKGMSYFGNETTGIVAGTYDNVAYLGAHNGALSSWTDIAIAMSGNVGIGITNPNYKLHVNGDSFTSGNIIGSSHFVSSSAITYNNAADKGKWFKIATIPSRGVAEFGVSWSVAGEHGYILLSCGQQYNSTPFIRVIEGNYYGHHIPQQFRLATDTASIYYDAYLEMYLVDTSWYETNIPITVWIVNKPPVNSSVTLFTTKTAGTTTGYTYYQVYGYHPIDTNWNGARFCLANSGNVGIGTNDPSSKFHLKDGRMDVHIGSARFDGLLGYNDASGRAQIVLSSYYSDLVIASSQTNDTHGSTLTFVTTNPSNAADYRKWVINQGNWGNRKHMLDFGYASNITNPHNAISSSATLLTLDGSNMRVGIGSTDPGYKLDVSGAIRASTEIYVNSWFRNVGTGGLWNDTYSRGIRCADAEGNNYGNISTHGEGRGGWLGYGLGTRYCFMGKNAGEVGIHDNINSWCIYFDGSRNCTIYGSTTLASNATVSGALYVGPAAGSGTIYLGGGASGDGAYDHSVIETRNYASSETTELLIFKGNDIAGPSGPDRIRLRAAEVSFDTYSGATTSRTTESIRMTIKEDGTATHTSGDNSYIKYGPNGWSGYLVVGASPTRINSNTAQVISTDGNLHLDGGNSKGIFLGHYADINGARNYINSYGSWTHSGSLSASGNITTPTVYYNGTSTCYIYNGNVDTYNPTGENNLMISSWWGIGFKSYDGGVRIAMNTRDGAAYFAGNIGIGITSPGHKLHVVGNIYATGEVTAFSDARYKTNITPLINCLEKIEKIKGVRYDAMPPYSTPTDNTHIGLLAQEVEEQFPELVKTDSNGMKSLNYSNMTAVLIECIKELNNKLVSKIDIINELENQNNTLSTRLVRLENILFPESG